MAGRAILLIVLVLTARSYGCTAAYVGDGGFSVEFIHRDSVKSPLHDRSLTLHDRVLAAVRRSTARPYAGGDPSGGVAEIVSTPYEYLMYVRVGTPPTRMLALADTGSNLVWFKCRNGTSISGAPPAAGGAPARSAFAALPVGTVCLAMAPVTDDRSVTIIGNIAQQNFRVGFDLDKGTVTFAAADCASSYPSPPASVSL
uniref:Uncharacterized protein n=1 Tax=Aegilops tauschii TaxID=37682 RepID=R7W3E5_AEGTA